jgi:hypothetical protein
MLCAAVLPTGSSLLTHGHTLETALRQTPNQRSESSGRCGNVIALAIDQRAMWPDRGNLPAFNRHELTIEYGINRADLSKLPDVDRELMRLLVSAVSK